MPALSSLRCLSQIKSLNLSGPLFPHLDAGIGCKRTRFHLSSRIIERRHVQAAEEGVIMNEKCHYVL